MNKYIGVIVFSIILSGCVNWPQPSTGGYAANYLFTPQYQKALVHAPYARVLSNRLAGLLQQAFCMRKSHARKCYPSRFLLLERLGEQIAQEIASGLFWGAETDLRIFQDNLYELKKLNSFKGCPRPKNSRSWEELKLREQ